MSPWRNPGTIGSLLIAAHPKQALAISVVVAGAAAVDGRPGVDIVTVLLAVLLGRLTFGLLNDVADRERDEAADRRDKPIAMNYLDAGTATFAVACLMCLVVPLSVASGVTAGVVHLLSVVAAWTYNSHIKLTALSPLPWALSFALLVAFLSYGSDDPGAPSLLLVFLAALLGVCVHVMHSLPDLVEDHANGVRSLPVRLGLKLGAPSLLGIGVTLTAIVSVLTLVVGLAVGLS